SDWALGLRETWRPGADGARFLLNTFIQSTLGDYQDARDYPAETGTTRLSAHLHFGEISPRQVWHVVRDAAARATDMKIENDSWNIIRQLCWRDFNHDLLSRHPDMATRNIDTRFDDFPWQSEHVALSRWQQGDTGYPIVDAGMRELWTTGWMHNRVRMIVASFLVKHLLIHWRSGEEWFWDTLIDADVANNAANWQWVAGCGADAAPYFRIFNPILQGEKFDPNGDYVRKWVPERADLSNKLIHKPTPADASLFEENYPKAMVEHGFARKRALDAFASLKR
ncbi:MAG: deoxyribodipyrimidine photo-lyase, partial [Pseudomonadota bacterium]|nr:deoxyribodipyrimidine photo-lyase [Pseudomonadota bacterium]